ncbi:YihY/virulence factor BrkB family protein [Microbacterium sp. SORGH_AS_0888]|uniref:YihY/virulence factor BrkB family protein n=1 Tax=Microbacterium sp. SORGH_AS_0888 TaxID=3041791 RepID=UPI002789A5F9|nr:YihY/virulence factor BrkB family protein [Microbacterium sp. SORGH_AS_0888]MDQ1128912.1 membrane protein [Microbacterium sp. SORGH_AS_0888]
MSERDIPAPSGARPGPIPRIIAWALQRTAVRAFLRYSESRGPALADSVTYRALFSLFAAVLLGFSFAGLWLAGNPDALEALQEAIQRTIPGIGDVIDFGAASSGLATAGIVSIIGLVGAAIGAIGSLRAAFRTIAGKVHDDTFFLWVLLRNLLLAVILGALLVASAVVGFVASLSIATVTGWLGLSSDSWIAQAAGQAATLVVMLALNTVTIVVAFRFLAGVRAPARALWTGALWGGVGLVVLQRLSGLFVGGAAANPLLATFASLIALLLWLNLSAQVILIAAAYIVTGAEEHEDRVRERYGAATFAQRRVRRAEAAVQAAADELRAAQEAEHEERVTAAAPRKSARDQRA